MAKSLDKRLDGRRMMILESRRVCETPPFIVMDVLERAKELEREGRSIIHLEVGEPDFRNLGPLLRPLSQLYPGERGDSGPGWRLEGFLTGLTRRE